MATPADQRLLVLLDTWLESLKLHARYSSLDDESYWKIQPWVEHQRPSRWIIDVAMQKTIALRTHIEERIKLGDTTYGDSVELVIFLSNLVGSDHIERFIPAADVRNERSLRPPPAPAPTDAPPLHEADEAPADETHVLYADETHTPHADESHALHADETRALHADESHSLHADETYAPHADESHALHADESHALHADETHALHADETHAPPEDEPHAPLAHETPHAIADTASRPPESATTTREMPKFPTAKLAPPAAGNPQVVRTERKPAAPAKPAARAAAKPVPKPQVRPAPKPAGKAHPKHESDAHPPDGPSAAVRDQVIADAARLVQWGRKWYELPELIARMAGRPSLPDVRRILKENKAAIEAKPGKK